jgi:hypothetical protein
MVAMLLSRPSHACPTSLVARGRGCECAWGQNQCQLQIPASHLTHRAQNPDPAVHRPVRPLELPRRSVTLPVGSVNHERYEVIQN